MQRSGLGCVVFSGRCVLAFGAFRDIIQSTGDQRRTFFKLAFGPKAEGYACIGYLHHTSRKMKIVFFKYPDELDDILESIEAHCEQLVHVYYSPALYESPGSREKRFVSSCPNIWVDLDKCDPRYLLVEPSILVQTSPERYQALWVLEDPLSAFDAEDVARRISYYHADQGADKCWDAGHFMRVPYTPNFKYGEIDEAPVVSVLYAKKSLYRVSDFTKYPNIPALSFLETEDVVPDLPDDSAEAIIERHRSALPSVFWGLYEQVPTDESKEGWSGTLYRLINVCAESGMRREETFVVANSAACNKYERDGRPETELWQDVQRSYVKHIEKTRILPTITATIPELLTIEEATSVQADETFVERYILWAKTLTDAPVQFHQAAAFILLSAIVAGSVTLHTSFGAVRPNLWFMILAGTTMTRKSTTMRFPMELLREIDPTLEMATDGSMEGLLTGLRDRSRRPSIFLKDEFTGLLESIGHKDYMAGMAEQLTKLYDGDSVKRLLRKETIEISNPIFIIYAGGIKETTQMLLNEDHVMSGFIPRFVFITADSHPDRIQPTGPPVQHDIETRELIKNELIDMYAHYAQASVAIQNGKPLGTMAPSMTVTLTSEAWTRYNVFEKVMINTALDTGLGYLTPVYDRLTTSTLKAAILIAASRQRSPQVTVELRDILHAIYYAQYWRVYASEVVHGIGQSSDERMMERIMRTIRESKSGANRGELMRMYRLDAKRADLLFTTLLQRQLIFSIEVGGQKRYKSVEVM